MENSTIDLLNDDVLLQIFSFLNLCELVEIGEVCQRFHILTTISLKKYKKVSFMLRTTNVKKLDKVFNRLVPFVESLTFSGGCCLNKQLNLKILNGMTKFEKLNELKLIYFRLDINILKQFENIFMNLNSLQLNRCDIDDEMMQLLINLPNLKTLDLGGNMLITGIFLPEFIGNITRLDLEFCSQLEYCNLEKFLYNKHHQLESLNLSFNSSFSDPEVNLLQIIVQTQPNIKALHIGEVHLSSDYSPFSNLKSLKILTYHQLKYYAFDSNIDNLLRILSISTRIEELDISFCKITFEGQRALTECIHLQVLKLKRLQTNNYSFLNNLSCFKTLLTLDVSYCDLSDENFIHILTKYENLKFLNLQSCKALSKKSFDQIAPILDAQKNRRQIIKIDVLGTYFQFAENKCDVTHQYLNLIYKKDPIHQWLSR